MEKLQNHVMETPRLSAGASLSNSIEAQNHRKPLPANGSASHPNGNHPLIGDPLPSKDVSLSVINDSDRTIADLLTQSKIYQDYERAFSETLGMPVCFKPADSFQLPLHGKQNENPICSLIAEDEHSSSVCQYIQSKLSEKASHTPHSLTCPVGLTHTAVPVRVGERLIGFLQTGQVAQKAPTEAQFDRLSKLVAEWGIDMDQEELRSMYFNTKIIDARHYEAIVRMLNIFAQHLSIISNQLLLEHEHEKSPAIARVKQYIKENQSRQITLATASKVANTSSYYFCKMFKRVTGVTFTDYLSRVRIERAKHLLRNNNLRISEVAFDVGFQSITHFNRVFKKITGVSPSEFRSAIPSP